jgi:hypothetical protein
MTRTLDALPHRRTDSHFAGKGNSLHRLSPLILSRSLFRLRPAAYLGALRPQPPKKVTPAASLLLPLLLSNPIKLL